MGLPHQGGVLPIPIQGHGFEPARFPVKVGGHPPTVAHPGRIPGLGFLGSGRCRLSFFAGSRGRGSLALARRSRLAFHRERHRLVDQGVFHRSSPHLAPQIIVAVVCEGERALLGMEGQPEARKALRGHRQESRGSIGIEVQLGGDGEDAALFMSIPAYRWLEDERFSSIQK